MRNKLLMLFVFVFAFSMKANEGFSAYLAQEKIVIGQPDTLFLSLVSNDLSVNFPAFNDTISKGLEVLGVGRLDTNITGTGIVLGQAIYFTSFDSGYFVIPPFQIQLKDSVVSSSPILLQVEEMSMEMEQDIKDILDIAAVPYTWKEIMMIIFKVLVVTVFISLIIIGFRHFYLKRKSNVVKTDSQVERVPFSTIFRERLEALKAEKIWLQGKEKLFQSLVSELLREYLEHRFEIKAMERTTSEISGQLAHSSINREDLERVTQMLRFADMVKFAKAHGATDDHEKALLYLEALTKHFGFIDGE